MIKHGFHDEEGRGDNKMKIFKVFSSLADEVYFGVSEWTFIRETNAWYEIKSEIKTKRLKKEELNVIYSETIEPHISFSVFCTEDKIEEMKSNIIPLLEERLNRQEKQALKKRNALEAYKEQMKN